ncbi:response regulator [Sphingomonas piscis]|uniref:histidine kinase n=1 Tax=Sphingomonas piscis TaxID=2714943 RepID=A0A6G7YT00_9SPHN|nr:response regulator [Sphingomonas piscis]
MPSSPSAEFIDRPRVLVVDDDERNLLAIQNVLDDLGELVIAKSGEEALRHLLKGEFAVILLDVYMPGLDGYETAQIIREREQTKRIPIVFLSAVNKEAEHLMRGYSMGAVDYVFKPVDPIVLRSKVAVFVDLFAKTKEIERKARQEQALLDANLRANAERLKVEQELRRAEQRQNAIIQSLPIMLYLEPLECEDRCPIFVSGNMEPMTGFTLEQVAGTPALWADRLHPDDRGRVLTALEERQQTGRFSVEYRWRCADDTYRDFHDQAVLLRDPAGRPIEFAGTLTDVTDRKSLESQLVHAQKMDAIGKLTGGIAHDFNNLLAAVIGGLGMIERRAALDEEQTKILLMTKRAAEQGTELVRRLLAFARRQKLEPSAIELQSLSEAVAELLTHTLGGLVQLNWRNEDRIWPAFADQAQLELALMNLIINARDAMPHGGAIEVEAHNRSYGGDGTLDVEAGDYVVISVSDTGHGIAPEQLEKVLEPFFTTKEVGKGTGLGLSMVYGFAQQSGGAFRLQSKVGKGTCAELWLPKAPDNLAAAREPSNKDRPVWNGRSLRILLVDDHEEVRRATAGMLEDLGHEVIEAREGQVALELVSGTGHYDLLVTDYAMPKQSGTDLIRQVRKHRPDLPSLIITGYADAEAISDRPADVCVLSKPFDINEMSSAIATCCLAAPAQG